MRDGVILRANIYRPLMEGLYPVLLTRLPYGKDTSMAYAALDPVRLAMAGYIVVIQDVRGRFASDGKFQNSVQEFHDGHDSVDFAAKIPGSNGDVGMFGMSYFGYTQWAAAYGGHKSLKAIVPAIAFDSTWIASVRNGAVEWGMVASWQLGAIAPYELARAHGREPEFPGQFGMLIHSYNCLAEHGYFHLPLVEFEPLKSLGILPGFFHQLARPSFDDEWNRISTRDGYEQFSADGFLIGGWYDIFLGNTLYSYQKLKEAGRAVRLLVGPWTHTNWSSMVGDRDFGMGAASSFLDLRWDITALHQQWFDNRLKGMDVPLCSEPPVKIFVMGENKWRLADDWPLPGTVFTPFYLHSGGHAALQDGDGRLSVELPLLEPTDHYIYDPAEPVPTHGGNLLMAPLYKPGPLEQSMVEQRADVLVFTSEPLVAPLTVIGPITAKLWVSSDALDTDFVVRLVDVGPDGSAYNLADGIVRMRYRNGPESPTLIKPGTTYEIYVDCFATANVFQIGHRIRVQVTSSCFPRWNRNLNTGASNETTAEFICARQAVFHDGFHPSHVVLPIIK